MEDERSRIAAIVAASSLSSSSEVARKWEKHQARAREAEEKAKLVAARAWRDSERLGRKRRGRIAEADRGASRSRATIAEYEAKDRETKMRMQVHEQMRSFATAFRV